MKEIKAFEATDGTPFFTESECANHEWVKEGDEFEAWYSVNQTSFYKVAQVRQWLTDNAEDIRGFLPPVETTKPELDIATLMAYKQHNNFSLVKISHVEKWLAGELK
jgi:hypothetical protein